MIQYCYERFMQNSTKSCKDVHNLRACILKLQPIGCHEMRNPWYTLAVGIIKNYRSCFIQNYTILLEALQQREGMAVMKCILKILRCSFLCIMFAIFLGYFLSIRRIIHSRIQCIKKPFAIFCNFALGKIHSFTRYLILC